MSADARLDAATAALLRDAAEWRLAARLFECPDPTWRDEVAALARELDGAAIHAAVEAIDDAATPGQYFSVFGPGGPAPPREASYHESLELGSLMSELAGYYEAFAYRPQCAETLDHVATEIGFVAYLKFKQAYAQALGEAALAEVAERAAARFIADHLSRIASPLAAILADSHLAYLAHASRLVAARAGTPPRSPLLPMLHERTDDDEEGFACGVP